MLFCNMDFTWKNLIIPFDSLAMSKQLLSDLVLLTYIRRNERKENQTYTVVKKKLNLKFDVEFVTSHLLHTIYNNHLDVPSLLSICSLLYQLFSMESSDYLYIWFLLLPKNVLWGKNESLEKNNLLIFFLITI